MPCTGEACPALYGRGMPCPVRARHASPLLRPCALRPATCDPATCDLRPATCYKEAQLETLTAILTIIILAVVPMVLYALFLWWMDRYEKEPLGLILAAFLWGAIPAVILSLIAQIALDIPASVLFGSSLGTELWGPA